MHERDIRILYVTSHWPHASSYGAQLRVLNIGRQLKRIGRVSLVIASPEEVDPSVLARTEAEFEVKDIMRVYPDRLRDTASRIRFELDPAYLNTHFSRVRKPARERMLQLIEEHDVVWVHTLRTANEFRIYRWPRTVVDLDDIPSRVYASRAKAGPGVMRRLLDYRLSLLWRKREGLLHDRFDVIGVCSANDRRYLGEGPRVRVLPNGFARPPETPTHAAVRPARFGFIGLCSYAPNRSGLEWFIREVWPRIKRRAPDARLRLAGLESDKDFSKRGPDIDGLGYLEDPAGEIASWTAMIVPIRTGGGTRIKIVEAFSRKCPVVSTALGAFGYEFRSGEELLLADTAADFAAACLRLTNNGDLAARLSENAWNRFLREWTWDAVGDAVVEAVRLCRGPDATACALGNAGDLDVLCTR
jgi:glycosyltransferase involved in cell wall biosynthesis